MGVAIATLLRLLSHSFNCIHFDIPKMVLKFYPLTLLYFKKFKYFQFNNFKIKLIN